ncbi:hypothetical protein K9N68_34430 (plasmid) [Kovacikia minuta CCNUW1]|uniref:COG1470 family protein n=1 Tax=Kovacikia minuta TaxID=2931930 RepID=UPI001CCD8EE8|nr:hypothetical protein [Kovacikia minuta]UBF30312.1 hypothetical protein K9N68_34430 [Kovacikia minuta CCNUW1]
MIQASLPEPEQPEQIGIETSFFGAGSLQTLAPGKPLAVILNSSGREVVTPGSVFSVGVTVHNKGKQSAIIDVSIDDRSGILQQWCLSLRERLALGANQSGEVVFPIRVPTNALPGLYPYLIVVDAQEHYPEDTPIQFPQRIQILPAAQDAVHSSDPTFILQPATNPTKPALIQPGGALAVQVLVHNRSDRVDRFRLVCTDLPRPWFNVTYPQGIEGAGLMVSTDSLNLNPGDQGLISLLLNPPLNALAGTYIPTLRLYSENNPDLVLLDLIYLQVPPIYLLQVELRTIISRVQQQAGIYQVRLNNMGNTRREVLLRVQNLDEEELCTYQLEHSQVRIAPKEVVGVGLQVQPKKWWRRPIFGGGRVLNFSVDLEDSRQLPLTIDHLPTYLLWEARPWWQIVPLILLGVLSLLAIAYLIWWWLFRVPPPAQIVQFFSEDPTYSAVNGDVVRLGWQISQPNRLQSLKITGLSADGKPLTRPETYDFGGSIPTALQPFCTQDRSLLTCRNVRTSARKPGTYIFELLMLPKTGRGATSATAKTNLVAIAPIPQPKIVGFASTQPIYQEPITPIAGVRPFASPAPKPAVTPTPSPSPDNKTGFGVRLNWAITQPERLRAIQLVGRSPEGLVLSPPQQYDFSQGIPPELRKFCVVKQQLICQNVQTNAKNPGDYVFELTALANSGSSTPAEARKTDLIKILPKPLRILEFKLNGQPSQPKYLIPLVADQPIPNLVLSWLVDGSAGTKVELLPAPGSVPARAAVPLILSPKPGSVTVTLQVTSSTGQQVVRSVTLETYDPSDPAAATAAAVATAIAESQKKEGASGSQGGTPVLDTPAPATPGTLSPIELPPQFDRR